MKKIIPLGFLIFCFSLSFGQEKFITKKGTVAFEASVPSFEEVKAKNEAVTVVFNTDNGEIASLALMKGFRFKNALMEEHFNENYIESDDYPKAKFKGKFEDFDKNNLRSKYLLKGELSLHGQTKPITTSCSFDQQGDVIVIKSSFIAVPEDFGIKIPGIVSKKIAKEVKVSFSFSLERK